MSTEETPGYGHGATRAIVHRVRGDGSAYCGAAIVTIGDRQSAFDSVRNYGARVCVFCALLVE